MDSQDLLAGCHVLKFARGWSGKSKVEVAHEGVHGFGGHRDTARRSAFCHNAVAYGPGSGPNWHHRGRLVPKLVPKCKPMVPADLRQNGVANRSRQAPNTNESLSSGLRHKGKSDNTLWTNLPGVGFRSDSEFTANSCQNRVSLDRLAIGA